jgi:PEP-CTERM motif
MQIDSWGKTGRALAMAAALVPAAAQATLFNQTAVFDFENIALGTTTTFTDTVNGLTATFTGSASVCAAGGLFLTLSGNVEIQDLCNNPANGDQSGPLGISFSEDLSSVSLDFATVAGPGTLTVKALENGNPVSTSTFNSTVPPGGFSGEGFASVAGTFNSLTLTSASLLAIDNISTPAVPEPASIALLGGGLAGFVLVRRRRKAG